MTPETIKAAIKEISGYESLNDLHWHRVGFDDLDRILTRILCPVSAPRPDSAGEGGKDRAGEMAAKLARQFTFVWNTASERGVTVDAGETQLMTVAELRAGVGELLVAALRAYGDEILEQAAQMLEMQGHVSSPGLVRVMKSSPTGATNV